MDNLGAQDQMLRSTNDVYHQIQDFGEDAFALAVWNEGSWEELSKSLKTINSSNPYIRDAINLELEERGLITGLAITRDGSLYDTPLSERLLFELEVQNVLMQFWTLEGMQRWADISQLCDGEEDDATDRDQVDMNDLLRALQLEKDSKTIHALNFILRNWNEFPNDDNWSEIDIAPHHLESFAFENGVPWNRTTGHLQHDLIERALGLP